MKKIIRLTEGDLHRLVKESVHKILSEGPLGPNTEWESNGIGFAINQDKKNAEMNKIETENMPKATPLTARDIAKFRKREAKNFNRNMVLHQYHLIAKDLLSGKDSTVFGMEFYKNNLGGEKLFKCKWLDNAREFLLRRYGIIPVVNLMNKTEPSHSSWEAHYTEPKDGSEPIFIPAADFFFFRADIKFKPGQVVDKNKAGASNGAETIKFSPEDEPDYMY